jgi:hypothetical protein
MMPFLKGLVTKTMRKIHPATTPLQTIVRRSTNDQSLQEVPLLPHEFKPEPDSAGSQHPARNNKLHKVWRYVDDRFLKKYLIRRDAIEKRKSQESGQAVSGDQSEDERETPSIV